MQRKTHSAGFRQTSLNTLAQNGTGNEQIRAVIIQGQGSDLANDKAVKGRAKRKMLSQHLVLNLIKIAEAKGHTDLIKSFWNTYHCQNRLYSHEGRFYGQYCKNRFCTLCCSIRKAHMINRYYPVLKQWEQPYFVTLTLKAVKRGRLQKVMAKMVQGFNRIKDRYRKRNQRGGCGRMIGVRSLECNFNADKQTYNPHFHIVVADAAMAHTLINEWLQLWTPKWAVRAAQNMQPVRGMESALIEIIKYGSKIFTEPDLNKKVTSGAEVKIYAGGLYQIFDAMKGLRLFERFGFNLPDTSQKAYVGARIINQFNEWIYSSECHDWLHAHNELTLSGYNPNEEIMKLLMHEVDNDVS